MVVLAHIAGLPIEETALNLAPVVFTAGGIAGVRLRRFIVARRPRRDAPPPEQD